MFKIVIFQISLMQSKLKGRSKEDEAKYREIDSTLKRLDRKIREGSVLDPSGPRGANKVSAMAEQLTKKNEPCEGPPIQKSSSKGTFVMCQQASDCHFCGKRVYLMERLSAEGVCFHRGCFRCEYCGSTLKESEFIILRERFITFLSCSKQMDFFQSWKKNYTPRISFKIKFILSLHYNSFSMY